MKTKKLLMKTLLVAAGLGVGANAWGETVNVTSTESAYVLKSSDENFNGTSNALVAYYTQYRNWGASDGTANFRADASKLVLYKFSLTDLKNASGSMTSATLTFTTTSTEDCYNVFAVGYNETWSASTVTGNNLTNNAGTITGVVTATGSFQPLGEGYASLSNGKAAKAISIDATTYVQSAIDAELDYVSFAIGINLGRNLPLNTTAQLTGVFTSAAATKYTVRYQNASGANLKDAVEYDTFVGETFTASSSDMATFFSDDTSKKYIYASGNASTTAVADATSNVITLVFNEYDKIAYTVTAKNGENTLGTLASGDAYSDGSTKVYWNKFKQFDSQWYETSGSYGKAITEAGNTDVIYNISDIAYFYEFETLSRSGGTNTVTETSTSHSNGSVGRIANSSNSYATLYTPALSAGVYTLNMPYFNGNAVTENDIVYVYVTDNVSSLGDPVQEFAIANTGGSNFTTSITIPEGYYVAFKGTQTYSSNSKARIDYVTFTKTADIIGATDNTSGFMAEHSDLTISQGQTATYTFQNHGGSANWYNWLLRIGNASNTWTLRADNFVLGDWKGQASTRDIKMDDSTITWGTFLSQMTDAAVNMTVTYAADGTLAVSATSTGSSNVFTHTFSTTCTGDIKLELGVEKCWLAVSSATVTGSKVSSMKATIGAKGYSTFTAGYPLDLTSLPAGLTAYRADQVADDAVKFVSVEQAVPASTGLLLRGTAGTEYEIPVAESASALDETNLLVGCAFAANFDYGTTDKANFYVMVNGETAPEFQNVADYLNTQTGTNADTGAALYENYIAVPGTKAYLNYESHSARALKIVFGDEATGISAVNGSQFMINSEYFNLSGQRVAAPQKGLYIVNGKKVVIK